MFKITRKKLVAGAVTVGLMAGAGVSFAYWTTTGAGDGSATTGTSTPVTVTQVGAVTGLVPGGPAGAVNFKINNPASFNQYITTVLITKGAVTGPNVSVATPCTAADFTLVQPDSIDDDLTPGDHTYSPSGATLKLDNTTSNQDGCKGASIALAFDAS